MARQSLALVVLSATLACALDVNTVNSSGRGLGFTWHGGLLRPHACRHAPCASVCSHPCGVALGLRQPRRAHQAACAHAHGHGHSHGEPSAAHDADCCGHEHASGADSDSDDPEGGRPPAVSLGCGGSPAGGSADGGHEPLLLSQTGSSSLHSIVQRTWPGRVPDMCSPRHL